MGNAKSLDFAVTENPNRTVFVSFKSWRNVQSAFGVYVVFTYTIRYYRYVWDVEFRYNDVVRLDRTLYPIYSDQLMDTQRPGKFNKLFWTHDQEFLTKRSKMMLKYMQDLLDVQTVLSHAKMRTFLNISASSFNPNMGRKGKEGYLKKCSGGYIEGFSRQMGDYLYVWAWRWVVLHDTCISWYKSPDDMEPRGTLQIDKMFRAVVTGRVITVFTATRKLLMTASTGRSAQEWAVAMNEFYGGTTRVLNHAFEAAFSPRMNCDVKAYTCTKDYYNSLTMSLLSAQSEILITSWKISPTVLLTRPPYPTLRLDQLLKYKADQGVKIFLLLYKEVEYVGQGNDSLRSKTYLESLSPNIRCIRHPNKFIGGSTAMMWSHHEKTVVIDRNLCFIGGVDLAFQRWDDEKHRVCDEDGVIYPGPDYRNPAPNLFKPLRAPPVKDPNNPQPDDDLDDEVIEVEIAMPGEQLPTAATATIDGEDDEPYEVEVVVDFGVAVPDSGYGYPALTASTVSTHNNSSTSSMPAAATVVTTAPAVGVSSSAQAKGSSERAETQRNTQSKDTVDGAMGVGGEEGESDRMSDVSENWAEDRFVPETAEERQAKADAMENNCDEADSQHGDPSESQGSLRQSDRRTTGRSSILGDLKLGYETSKASIRSSLGYLQSQVIQGAKELYTRHVTQKSANSLEPRELYPRMPWHDVQASVSGLVARDIASHFVQRWNHHRISTSLYSEPILHDITDNTEFGVCARCLRPAIKEDQTHCPDCSHYLGPGSSYAQPVDPARCPVHASEYSFIVFECTYPGKLPLPFRMLGDCPVVVTAILQNSIATSSGGGAAQEGNLLDLQGPQAEWLHAFGLVPAIGDVVVAVDSTTVTHLNSNQCKRLVKKKRSEIRSYLGGRAFVDLADEPTIRVTFRRHFLENLYPVDKKLDPAEARVAEKEAEYNAQVADSSAAKNPGAPALDHSMVPVTTPIYTSGATASLPAGNRILAEAEMQALEAAEEQPASSFPISAPVVPSPPSKALSPPSAPAATAAMTPVDGEMKCSEEEGEGVGVAYSTQPMRPAAAAIPIRDEEVELGKARRSSMVFGGEPAGASQQELGAEGTDDVVIATVAAMPLHSTTISMVDASGDKAAQSNASKVRQFHPACAAAAQVEVKLAMSTLFHTFYRGIETPSRLWDDSGTCKVQLLRSIGKWSTGTKEETSIQNCYIDSINSAKHFIYIENQFFVSSTAGSDVSNGIATALVNRILQAHTAGEEFRVLVLIPLHPNGDFAAAKKSQVVMHFEYATINRGAASMFEQLRRRAPGIPISKYLGFHSLRNWGVINNKVVSDQVYVHDKVMIVDDRVAIIGSANINDRSMLGERDSELAIRIEDTLHCNTSMAGQPFTVGFMPHTLRVRLMRSHMGEGEDFDLSDPLSEAVQGAWKLRSNSNSAVYDQIDGPISAYRVTTLGQYRDAFAGYVNPSYLDPGIQHTMAEIRGFLVDWPQTLLEREDMSPTLALRTVIPNALWV